jgi:hypothetical protein
MIMRSSATAALNIARPLQAQALPAVARVGVAVNLPLLGLLSADDDRRSSMLASHARHMRGQRGDDDRGGRLGSRASATLFLVPVGSVLAWSCEAEVALSIAGAAVCL